MNHDERHKSQHRGAAMVKRLLASPSRTPSYVAFLVKVLFVLLILLLLPRLVESKSKRRRNALELRALRRQCEQTICDYRELNCVFFCISPSCYEQIYGPEPLEAGEIDLMRGKTFEHCAQKDLRRQRNRS